MEKCVQITVPKEDLGTFIKPEKYQVIKTLVDDGWGVVSAEPAMTLQCGAKIFIFRLFKSIRLTNRT